MNQPVATSRQHHLYALIGCLAVFIAFFALADYEVPEDDEVRYIDYALNVAQHGVFGLSDYQLDNPPEPGAANAPLYPGFLGLMAALDESLFTDFYCAGTAQNTDTCSTRFGAILFAQHLIAGFALFCIWGWARAMFDSSQFASLVAAGAVLSGELQDMAARFLTENFVLPLFFLFMWAFAMLLREQRTRWWVIAGVSLGLLALTRPEYLQLSLVTGLTVAVVLGVRRQISALKGLVLATAVFAATLTPWSLRNSAQLGELGVTAGGYAEAILAYRFTFNRMSAAELGAAFVFWTPDVGDKLAEAFLAPESYERLVSKNPNSFRSTAITEVLDPLLEQMPAADVAPYMIRTYVFEQFWWYASTSAALFYRGIFVGKYWGIIAFGLYLFLLWRTVRNADYRLLWLSLPIWALVALHALISANVPRYNLVLISIYSIGWGWLLTRLFSKFLNEPPPPALRRAN